MDSTTGWYNERCHKTLVANVNRWRCRDCGLCHFFCVKCKQFKTIPDAWEMHSFWTLNKRMEYLETKGWLCDPCWFAIREKILVVPKVESPKTSIYISDMET